MIDPRQKWGDYPIIDGLGKPALDAHKSRFGMLKAD
jgi:hypothetical protein